MNKKQIFWMAFIIISAVAAGIAVAQQPTMVAMQGKVTDNVGNPVSNGNLRVTVATSDSCESGVIYDYTYNGIIQAGLFNILLGNDSQLNMTYNRDYYACTWVNGEILGNAQQINRTKFRGGYGQINTSNLADGVLPTNWTITGDERATGNWNFTGLVNISNQNSFIGDIPAGDLGSYGWIKVKNGTFSGVTSVDISGLSGYQVYRLEATVKPWGPTGNSNNVSVRVNGIGSKYRNFALGSGQSACMIMDVSDTDILLISQFLSLVFVYEPSNRTVSITNEGVVLGAGSTTTAILNSCMLPQGGGGAGGVDIGNSISSISILRPANGDVGINGSYVVYGWSG